MIKPLFISLLALTVAVSCTTPVEPPEIAQRIAPSGAVSSADPRANAAGEAILAKGGSASDAAIAVMLALTVVEPQSSGIGGGGFLLRADSFGAVQSFDGRETAPVAATGRRFLDKDGKPHPREIRTTSGLSVGVPGNLAMAARVHGEHGKLAWSDLFAPAIALAEDGFLMNRRLNGSLSSTSGRSDKTEAARSVFFDSEGKPLPVGTRITNPALAEALRHYAARGPEAMYGAGMAEQLATYVAAETPLDGAMTAGDVTSYQAKLRDPVCGNYRGYTVCGMGPPSSGGIAVVQMLGQLERFDLASIGPDSPQFWHLFLESQRVAYADRELYIGDSDFVSVPVEGLLNPDYLAARSKLIDPSARLAKPQAGTPPGAPVARADGDEGHENGTSHFSVADAAGNVVSFTSTIEGAFGSGLFYRGFYLNNELTDFSFSPEKDGMSVANRVEGGKRPRSSMAPTIVFDKDGAPLLIIGAAGGPTIPVQVTRSIIGVLDFGMTANEALAMPFIMGFGSAVIIEEGTALAEMEDVLKALGHENIRTAGPPLKANALLRTQAGWEVAMDPRITPKLATQ